MTTENFGENRFRLVHHKGSGGHPYVVAEAVPHRGSPKPVTAAPIKHGRGILKRKLGEKPLPKEIAIHWLT